MLRTMRKFISPTGEVVKTKTIKEFSDKYGLEPVGARMLACGMLKSFHGWMSFHPKAKKKRKRIMTKLINVQTYAEETLGNTVRAFADKHNLCSYEVCNLLTGKRFIYKNWVLRKTYDNVNKSFSDANF